LTVPITVKHQPFLPNKTSLLLDKKASLTFYTRLHLSIAKKDCSMLSMLQSLFAKTTNMTFFN